jgi:hypothetical protein
MRRSDWQATPSIVRVVGTVICITFIFYEVASSNVSRLLRICSLDKCIENSRQRFPNAQKFPRLSNVQLSITVSSDPHNTTVTSVLAIFTQTI